MKYPENHELHSKVIPNPLFSMDAPKYLKQCYYLILLPPPTPPPLLLRDQIPHFVMHGFGYLLGSTAVRILLFLTYMPNQTTSFTIPHRIPPLHLHIHCFDHMINYRYSIVELRLMTALCFPILVLRTSAPPIMLFIQVIC